MKKISNRDDQETAIVAMADGKIVEVSEIKDPVFTSRILGRTIAFRFSGEQVTLCSPVSGIITSIFPGGEAFTMRTDNGVELLAHIGIQTGAAEGKGFERYHVKPGDKLICGSEIVTIDYEILSRKYDMTTMLIITDAKNKSFSFLRDGTVRKGQSILN